MDFFSREPKPDGFLHCPSTRKTAGRAAWTAASDGAVDRGGQGIQPRFWRPITARDSADWRLNGAGTTAGQHHKTKHRKSRALAITSLLSGINSYWGPECGANYGARRQENRLSLSNTDRNLLAAERLRAASAPGRDAACYLFACRCGHLARNFHYATLTRSFSIPFSHRQDRWADACRSGSSPL
jgi:hypothetical protein